MKTSKCQLIYRNVSKTSDRDNGKTLKVDKIEFFGNFPRNVFCAFAVTLLVRPEKLDVDDHGCFASPSCDDQSFAGRKVVLIGFFDNLHSRHHPPCSTTPPSSQKTATAGFYMRLTPTTLEMSNGDEFATVSQAGSEGSNILLSIAPQLHTCPPNPPRDANTPWDAASRVRDGSPPFQTLNTMRTS